MEKKTVIANISAVLSLSEELQEFLGSFTDNERAWFAQSGGDAFLKEFGSTWNESFVQIAQSVLDIYFRDLGLPEDQLPTVELTDSRRGSWMMEAALTMFGTVGTTYTLLKAVADLPKIADGLEETKKRLQSELASRFRSKIPEVIVPVLANASPTATLPRAAQSNPASVHCSIDARPLRGLTPDVSLSHSIHLAVSISRSAVSIENLGEEPIENLQIGLFKSSSQRHSWSYGEAYSKSIPRLSAKQSTSLSIDQFISEQDQSPLNLQDRGALYVDCWVQDISGIYLFNFLLE